jgi:hypothetical protein
MGRDYKYEFVIFGGGDSSVGIPSSHIVVTIEGNAILNKEGIEEFKDILRDWDDNGSRVLTAEEYDKMIEEVAE